VKSTSTPRDTSSGHEGGDADDGALALDLSSLQQRTRVHEAAEMLLQRVVSGEFQTGKRLPSERTLVQQLGVSRTVLRESLSSLEALGFIEARTTRGRYVTVGGSSSRSRMLVRAWLHQHARQISEFDEIRSVIEAQAVRAMGEWDAVQAARQGRELVAEQQAAVDAGDVVRAADCDARFHRLLCSFTRNEALRSLVNGLIENARTTSLAVYSLPDASGASLDQHRQILAALEAGEVERAADMATLHTMDTARRSRTPLDQT
jgi:GntR family transcriptional repressor for pyruvate dehydrogenase complex